MFQCCGSTVSAAAFVAVLVVITLVDVSSWGTRRRTVATPSASTAHTSQKESIHSVKLVLSDDDASSSATQGISEEVLSEIPLANRSKGSFNVTSIPAGYFSLACVAPYPPAMYNSTLWTTSPSVRHARATSRSAARKCLKIPRISSAEKNRKVANIVRYFVDNADAADQSKERDEGGPDTNSTSYRKWSDMYRSQLSTLQSSEQRLKTATRPVQSEMAQSGRYVGVRLLVVLGRARFLNITLRAVANMLLARGGVACQAVLMCYSYQLPTISPHVETIFAAAGLDINSTVMWQVWADRVPRWNFTRLYASAEDGYVNLKIDDDLLYIQPSLDVELVHAFLFPSELVGKFRPDVDNSTGCEVVSANVVNHHHLTAIHQQTGAIDFLMSSPLNIGSLVVSSDYAQPAVWALIQRSFLRQLVHENIIASFDFGLHSFDCDFARRRWSVNCFVSGWNADRTHRLPFDDELYISQSHTYVPPRRRPCAVGSAIVVHAFFQHQMKWILGIPGGPELGDIAVDRLVRYYDAISLHLYGGVPCCDDGCFVFNDTDSSDSVAALTCTANDECVFPYTPEASNFAAMKAFFDGSLLHGHKKKGTKKNVRRKRQKNMA